MNCPPIFIPATCIAVTSSTRNRHPKNVPGRHCFPAEDQGPAHDDAANGLEEVWITETQKRSSHSCRDENSAEGGQHAADDVRDSLDEVHRYARQLRRLQVLPHGGERPAESRAADHKSHD